MEMKQHAEPIDWTITTNTFVEGYHCFVEFYQCLKRVERFAPLHLDQVVSKATNGQLEKKKDHEKENG